MNEGSDEGVRNQAGRAGATAFSLHVLGTCGLGWLPDHGRVFSDSGAGLPSLGVYRVGSLLAISRCWDFNDASTVLYTILHRVLLGRLLAGWLCENQSDHEGKHLLVAVISPACPCTQRSCDNLGIEEHRQAIIQALLTNECD